LRDNPDPHPLRFRLGTSALSKSLIQTYSSPKQLFAEECLLTDENPTSSKWCSE